MYFLCLQLHLELSTKRDDLNREQWQTDHLWTLVLEMFYSEPYKNDSRNPHSRTLDSSWLQVHCIGFSADCLIKCLHSGQLTTLSIIHLLLPFLGDLTIYPSHIPPSNWIMKPDDTWMNTAFETWQSMRFLWWHWLEIGIAHQSHDQRDEIRLVAQEFANFSQALWQANKQKA